MIKLLKKIKLKLFWIKFNIKCQFDPYCALDMAKAIRHAANDQELCLKYIKEDKKKEFLKMSIGLAEHYEGWYMHKTGKALPREHIQAIRKY